MLDDRISVLVVDDEPDVRDLLGAGLSDRSCVCIEAADGITALNMLAEQDFDVVLLDIRLPGMSGMDVLRAIRQHHPGTAVIMMTAVNDVDTAVKAMKLGAVDYILKPFDLGKVGMSVLFAIATVLDTSLGERSFGEMEAIALGVEQQREMIDSHSRLLTQSIVEIARQLGVPEREIDNWITDRLKRDLERKKPVQIAIDKLERSPIAQALLGVSKSHVCPRTTEGLRN